MEQSISVHHRRSMARSLSMGVKSDCFHFFDWLKFHFFSHFQVGNIFSKLTIIAPTNQSKQAHNKQIRP
jgi:hypothetical protein